MSSSRQKSTKRLLEEANQLCYRIIESLDDEARKAVYVRAPDQVPQVADAHEQRIVTFLTNRLGRSLTRYLQIHTVIEDTAKCRRMAKRYPWHGTEVSKSDHFYFVWFNFTNQCYLFKERLRLFLNEFNELRVAMGAESISVASSLKKTEKSLGEYIRHRGTHVHEWHSDHISYSTFTLIDFMHRNSGGLEYADRHKDFYQGSKLEMQFRMDRAIRDMCDIFIALDGKPNELLTTYLSRFGEYLRKQEAVFPEPARRKPRRKSTQQS